MLKQQASDWVRTVAASHLPSNTRRYTWNTYTGERSVSSSFGFQFDPKPAEGKVVAVSEEFVLLRVGRTELFVAARAVLAFTPEIGSVCRITPYSRRRFDGLRLDTPREEKVGDGVTVITRVFGESRTELPIDKSTVVYPQFLDMINMLETERADDIRSITQVMIDAGALLEPVFFQDVTDEEQVIANPPTVRFRVQTQKHSGYLSVVYDRAMDSYSILLLDKDLNELQRFDNEFVTLQGISTIGQRIIDLVDDGQWRIAPVEVLKAAPRRREAAAA